MAWHVPKVRVSALPVLDRLDLTVGIITSENGEVEVMPPIVFDSHRTVARLAKRLAKQSQKGGPPVISPDSEVVMMVRKTREVSDRWVKTPDRML